jgi:hypothetical protein
MREPPYLRTVGRLLAFGRPRLRTDTLQTRPVSPVQSGSFAPVLRFGAMFRYFLLLVVLALLLTSAAQLTPSPMPRPAAAEGLLNLHTEQLKQAAPLYEIKCSTCHGVMGGGLEESRQNFPVEHKRCEYCHNPLNPPRMSVLQMEQLGTAFSIGEPPPLSGEGALASFPSAQALHRYIRAAMPRHAPGHLSDEEYWGVTAYVLNLLGALPEGTTLSEANAAALRLHD